MQGKVWKMLVDLELEHSNLDGAVEIFGKSLLQCYNVTLWMSYMAFIKKVHPVVPSWGHDMCCDRNLPVRPVPSQPIPVTCRIPVLHGYVLLLCNSTSSCCIEQMWNVEQR